MGPIKTAVKYSLVPLRTIVRIGENFVGDGEANGLAEEPASTESMSTTKRRKPAGAQATRRPKDLDDVGLARKVESIIFRDDNVPKGKIDVNAADGVVWLRGEAKTPEMINELEAVVAAIPEVKQVENLLHLPKTPAPSRTDTPSRQRRTRSTTKKAASSRKVSTSVTNERRRTKGEEPLPAELAREGEGRQPAPLGSEDEESEPAT